MKSPREDLLSLYRRQGVECHPVGFQLCPSLEMEFWRRHPLAVSYQDHFGFPYRTIYDPGFAWNFGEIWRIPPREVDWHCYYPEGFQHTVTFEGWGVAHEDNPDSMHMTRMHHPLKDAESVSELKDYPWPDFAGMDWSYLRPAVEALQSRGLAAFVWAECTIWETAWYLRGMDKLLIDMSLGDEKAIWLLDHLTDLACLRARRFAEVRRNLGIAGSKGGLFCCPTHMLEPEVPWENILAYVEAVRSFRNQELAFGAFDWADNLYPRSTI